jgi:F-type H+-transporting ATPase subunit epsilon
MLKIQILSPEKNIFEGTVNSIKLPGTNGEFHVFQLHADLISTLTKGEIKIEHAENIPHFLLKDHFYHLPVTGGVVEIKENTLVILID